MARPMGRVRRAAGALSLSSGAERRPLLDGSCKLEFCAMASVVAGDS